VKVSSLINKFKDKSFARRVERGRIEMCEDIGMPLEEFLELSLEAMKRISNELGL